MKQYQNYIFDLYGTLVDIKTNERKKLLWEKTALLFGMQGAGYTGKELKKRYQELVREHTQALYEEKILKREEEKEAGEDISAILPQNMEIRLEQIFHSLFQEKGMEPAAGQTTAFLLCFRALSLEHISLYEGAGELLERLRREGKHIYLLSNAQRMLAEPEMRMLGIYDRFDDVLYSSDIGFKKPSFYFYDALFQKHGLKKEASVMIGNEYEADIAGSYRYGIDSIYIFTKQSGARPKVLPGCCREVEAIGKVM